jgi:3-oxoacyl-[acyl-carrier protein] reductase
MSLAGNVALITGGSTGIGRATALLLAKQGADIAINYLASQEQAEQVKKEVLAQGRKAIALPANVASKAEVDGMVRRVVEELGRIDILVNNAGTLVTRSPLASMPEEVWDRAMAVNLKGVFLCSQAVIGGMIERGYGRLVNIASVGVFTGGGGGGSHYVAAKGGVVAFTRALAMELAGHGIRVNAIAPGIIDTPFHLKFSTPEAVQKRVKGLPLRRAGTAEEIARAVLFLVDDECGYITGQTVTIDGGMAMNPGGGS